MTRKIFYQQCCLQRINSETSVSHDVAYIPSSFARIGNRIKIKRDEDWDPDWVVTSVGSKVAESELPDSHEMAKSHRRATGDSLRRKK